MHTRRGHEFDHVIPGLTILLGVLGAAAGAVLPWEQSSGPKFGINLEIFSAEIQGKSSISGLDHGAQNVTAFIAVAAITALVIGLLLMARHRRRGLLLRLVALVCGCSISALGIYFLTLPSRNHSAAYDLLSRLSLVSVKAGTGAYLLTLGGVLVALGALIPGRRRPLALQT